jgi:CO/xanthine dehydrogenase Mo-binding subunit
MTGGAVKGACAAVRERVFERVREEFGAELGDLSIDDEMVFSGSRGMLVPLAELLGEGGIEETFEFHHKETFPFDERGQGNAHVQFAFAAHRAVVEVDTELGLVRVVEIATAQDVGKAMNPQALEGQIEGGIAQGLGLALLEEIQISEGRIQNASFTDYLIPTILDMPTVRAEILELADPEAPYGLRGAGEPPTIASTPAIVSALRDATGQELARVPVKPEQIVGIAERPPERRAQPGSGGHSGLGRLDERSET